MVASRAPGGAAVLRATLTFLPGRGGFADARSRRTPATAFARALRQELRLRVKVLSYLGLTLRVAEMLCASRGEDALCWHWGGSIANPKSEPVLVQIVRAGTRSPGS
jgi:hypothetical protein